MDDHEINALLYGQAVTLALLLLSGLIAWALA